MDRTIKFSHVYKKLLNKDGIPIRNVILLEVLPVELSELTKDFLNYDTDFGKYTLPKKGKYLMLIFWKDENCEINNIFTTLRRYTDEKYRYYKNKIGKNFGVKIEKNETN